MVQPQWEAFHDPSYFDMWCVRKVEERRFVQGFHLVSSDEAKALCRLLNNLSPAAPDKATAPTLSGVSVGQGDKL
jgi:hypothetical protein